MHVFRICGAWLCVAISVAASNPFDVWHPRNLSPTGVDLNCVAYGNGHFVAVGDSGTVITSTNGTDWEPVASSVSHQLNTITFAEGRFVAGGVAGTVVWSESGTNWTRTQLPVEVYDHVTALGFGRGTWITNGVFVAMTSGGSGLRAYTSVDGKEWPTNGSSLPSAWPPYTTIAYGHNQFLATGVRQSNPSLPFLTYSTDGKMWQQYGRGPCGPIAFGNGLFVVAEVFTSISNVVTLHAQATTSHWNWVSNAFSGSGQVALGICYGAGRFVVAGGAYMASSSDGTNWLTGAISDIESGLKSVTFGDGMYVAVGSGGLILSSPDAITWTLRTQGVRRTLNSIATDGDGFVAVGSRGVVLASSDGVRWEKLPEVTTNHLRAVTKDSGKYVLAGEGGTIVSGALAVNLVQRVTDTEHPLNSIAFGNETFVVVGDQGTVLTSSDAESWNIRASGTTNRLRNAAFGAGQFVAVGDNGVIVSSGDGIAWQPRDSGTNRVIADVAYGNSNFLALCASGPILSSIDGIVWRIRSLRPPPAIFAPPSMPGGFPGYPNWNRLTYGDGLFTASAPSAGQFGMYFTSSDGRLWDSHYFMPRTNIINDIVYNDGRVISVGNYGRIYQSDPILRLTLKRDSDSMRLTLTAPKDGAYRIEARDSLDVSTSWETVTNLSSAPIEWEERKSDAITQRIYRASSVPEPD